MRKKTSLKRPAPLPTSNTKDWLSSCGSNRFQSKSGHCDLRRSKHPTVYGQTDSIGTEALRVVVGRTEARNAANHGEDFAGYRIIYLIRIPSNKAWLEGSTNDANTRGTAMNAYKKKIEERRRGQYPAQKKRSYHNEDQNYKPGEELHN